MSEWIQLFGIVVIPAVLRTSGFDSNGSQAIIAIGV